MKIVFVANHYVSKKRAMQGFMAYLTRTASALKQFGNEVVIVACGMYSSCLLYTSEAADEYITV